MPTGKVEPSGRLTLSAPRSAEAGPYFYNHKFMSSGTPVARHFGRDCPFGHGLSCTRFAFDDLELESHQVDIATGTVRLAFTLRNTDARKGAAMPQLCVRDKLASLVRQVKDLKAFGRVALDAGEAAHVQFAVPVDMLNFTGYEGRRIVEPELFDLMVDASSADIRFRAVVDVSGQTRILPCDWRMQSDCDIVGL